MAELQRRITTRVDVVAADYPSDSLLRASWLQFLPTQLLVGSACAEIGGQALVVPDLAKMALLPSNQGIPPGDIDLEQSTVAWEALVNSLADGKSVQEAVNSANAAITSFYGSITSWPNGQPLAQVIYTVIGDLILGQDNQLVHMRRPNACPKQTPEETS